MAHPKIGSRIRQLGLERLEPRQFLASDTALHARLTPESLLDRGNVTTELDDDRVLYLRGDAKGNEISVSGMSYGRVRVSGLSQWTTIDGEPAYLMAPTGREFVEFTNVSRIVIDMAAGDDVVVLSEGSTFPDIEMGTGEGNDRVALGTVGVNMHQYFGGGAIGHAITVRQPVRIEGNLAIDLGAGNDELGRNNAVILGHLVVQTGPGDDQLLDPTDFETDDFGVLPHGLHVLGATLIDANVSPSDADLPRWAIARPAFELVDYDGGNVTAEMIDGVLTIRGDDADNFLSVLSAGDTIYLQSPNRYTTINGWRQPRFFDAATEGILDAVPFTGVTSIVIELGAGDDQVTFSGSDMRLPATTIRMGSGRDGVMLGGGGNYRPPSWAITDGIYLPAPVQFRDEVRIDLGAGRDLLHFYSFTLLGALFVQTGPEADILAYPHVVETELGFWKGQFYSTGPAEIDVEEDVAGPSTTPDADATAPPTLGDYVRQPRAIGPEPPPHYLVYGPAPAYVFDNAEGPEVTLADIAAWLVPPRRRSTSLAGQ